MNHPEKSMRTVDSSRKIFSTVLLVSFVLVETVGFGPSSLFFEVPKAHAANTTVTILTANPCTGLLSWSVPSDWDDANNIIEIIGAGGDGNASATTAAGGGGGGGGRVAKTN